MLNVLLTHTPLLYVVQSFWRDEAFSVLAAQKSLSFIISKLGFEPPVYYTLLHFWMKIFGSSEIATRSLSFIGFILATVIIIEWGAKLYKNHWLSWFLPLFFFLNPMLLYYAFEVRTYGWYTFFATAMLYTFATKHWRWFVVAAVLGFYTHVYLLPFIGVLGLLHLWSTKKWKSLIPFFLIAGLISPWLVKIALEATRLRSSWYFPVNLQLVTSVLGNMFTGYEGTPWYGWKYTPYLSLVIVSCALIAFRNKTGRQHAKLVTIFGVVPLALIVGISFAKPLFVNRYLIPTTIAEVLIVVAALSSIRHALLQKLAAGALLAGVLWFNWWYPPEHPKLPIRNTFDEIHTVMKSDDIYLAADSIIYLETLYYARDRSRVYLYNPDGNSFPWYIGDALITADRHIRDFPTYPNRAFLVKNDATFEVVYRMPL